MNRLDDRITDDQLRWLVSHKPYAADTDETQTERARDALIKHIGADSPGPEATRAAPARRRRTSTRWAVRLAAVGAAATVAAVVAAAVPQGDRGLADAAVILHVREAATVAGASSALTMIAYDQSSFGGGEYWSLFDKEGGSIQRTRLVDDEPKLDGYSTTRLRNGRWQQRIVTWNLTNHTWTVDQTSFDGPTASELQQANDVRTPSGISSSAAEISEALSRGDITIVSRGSFEGRPAFRLRVAPFEGYDRLLWVDAKTYQPIQLTEYRGGKETGRQTWIPLTPQTRGLLTPEVPAGYQRLSVQEFSDRVNHGN